MLLKIRFELILDSQDFNQLDDIVCINAKKVNLYLMYEHYTDHGLVFQKLSIYKYFQCVFFVKCS